MPFPDAPRPDRSPPGDPGTPTRPGDGRSGPRRDDTARTGTLTPPGSARPVLGDDHDDAIVLAGRYRLDRRIGQGGMAEVWVAADLQLDRYVAVKWLKPALATDPVVAERFRREAIAVARLNHPNIVTVHDVFAHEGRQAVVMQLVDGKSLRQLLDGQKRLGPELTIHIGACVAGALDEAHRAGFVHRDVKPGNILVTSDGRVLLTDFGIAKGLDTADDDLTSENVMMGTAKYLSPEQVRGKRLDGRADLYALGLVLYECLAGRVPFLGESDADTALARLQRDPTDLHRLRPTLPTGLVELIHRTLARNPAHRPATGAELRAALMRVDTTPPHIEHTPAEPPRRPPVPMRTSGPVGPVLRAPAASDAAAPTASTPTLASAAATAATASTVASPTASGSHPAIPGQPRHSDPDATPLAQSDRAGRRDRTPPAGVPIHGRPARGMQQSARASNIVIGLLLLAALVVAAVLLLALRMPDTDPADRPGDEPAAAADGAASDDVVAPADAADAAPDGPATIASVTAWDPDGDNGGENDAQAVLVLPDSGTEGGWPTECYSSQYLGAKRGVGLVVALTAPSGGTASVESLNAPYQLQWYATAADVPPADLDAWGQPLDGTAYDTAPGTVEVEVPAGTTHLLAWLRELGPDAACSGTNPYRGRLGELTFRP